MIFRIEIGFKILKVTISYIFLDESGDLGFDFTKKRTSKFFVVTMFPPSGSTNHLLIFRSIYR